MNKILLLFPVILIYLSSCSRQTSYTAKTMDIETRKVTHIPVVADLDIKEQKAKAVVTTNIKKGVLTQTVKDEAVAKILQETNADILVEPNYKIETTATTITVTVTGYPATYKNFRNLTEADQKLLTLTTTSQQSIKTEENNTVNSDKNIKRKKIGKNILKGVGIYFGVAIIIALIAAAAG